MNEIDRNQIYKYLLCTNIVYDIVVEQNTYLFFRLGMEFNQIYEYSLFATFSWDLFGLSGILVTLQFLLVEYIFCIYTSRTDEYSLI